jgi:hypothetical protein
VQAVAEERDQFAGSSELAHAFAAQSAFEAVGNTSSVTLLLSRCVPLPLVHCLVHCLSFSVSQTRCFVASGMTHNRPITFKRIALLYLE